MAAKEREMFKVNMEGGIFKVIMEEEKCLKSTCLILHL